MLIAAVAMAAVVPNLLHTVVGRRCPDVASTLCSLAGYARTQAMAQGTTYRLNIDPNARTYYLSVQQGATFGDVGNDFGEHFALPEGVQIDTDIHAQPDGTYVQFTPEGRCDAATVTIRDDSGASVQVTCESPTELYHVVDANVKQ